LARAKERAADMETVAFAKTDAATQILSPDHQLIFSRFGVMFFELFFSLIGFTSLI
jgi:hypothetical protein